MNYDLIILGGGIVGLAQAVALSRGPFKIALVDASSLSLPLPPSLRVSALNRTSQQFLSELGVWSGLTGLSPYRQMELFDGDGPCRLRFSAAYMAEPDLGHIVDNQALRTGLLQALAATSVQLIEGCRPVALAQDGLQLDDGQRLHARLLIGAEGVDSWLRQQTGLGVRYRDYRQTALVCQIRSEQPHQQTARQRFLPGGPLALLPLADSRQLSIVWSLPPEQAKVLMAAAPEQFEAELNRAWGTGLGPLRLESERQSVPLAERQAQAYVQAGVALIGDAAHSIHPMAGLGLNLGLEDVATLSQILLTPRGRHSPGALAGLLAYQRRRRSANAQMQSAIQACQWLFGDRNRAILGVRRWGMSLLESTSLKHRLARLALYGQPVD